MVTPVPSRPRGTKPKPIEVKRLNGNPGCRPLPKAGTLAVLQGAAEPPEPHRPLGQVGRQLWDRAWTAGAVWLAEKIDCESLIIICEQADERQALRAKVFREGHWRDRNSLRALDAQIMNGLALLGFNPVDRARMGVAEVKQSPLDEFMARRQQRGS